MSLIPANLATEDELSETMLKTVLGKIDRFAVGAAYRRGGFGYLRRTIHGWNNAAKGHPFIVLTDLDDNECPVRLINDWLPEGKHPNLLFRIAVREVESWILADTANLSKFFKIRETLIPPNPDALPDPKAALLDLARKSTKSIRDSLVPRSGSTARQGPDYNGCLGSFVQQHWDMDSAKANSPSLSRAVDRLTAFEPFWV